LPDYEPPSGAPASLSADDVRILAKELRAVHSPRNQEYAESRDLYEAKHWGTTANPLPDGKRYTLTLNYIRPTVDKTVQLLLGTMPGIQVFPPGVDQLARNVAESEEALIYATWDVNDAPLVFRRVAHNMALLRRGLIYYWWDATAKRVRFRSVAPDNFYPLYDGEEIVECILVSRRSTRVLKRNYPKLADNIVPDNQGDDVFDEGRWMRMVGGMADVLGDAGGTSTRSGNSDLAGQTTVLDWYDKYGNWVRVMGDATHSQKLGYGIDAVPFIEFPNKLPGDEREPSNEVDDIVDLVLYLDILLSQQADIIKKYANPTIIDQATGQDPQTIKRTVQADGGVLPVKRDGDLHFLNWEGTAPDIGQQFDRVLAAVYDLSGKPPSAYGQLLSQQSGTATNVSQNPVTAIIEEKQSIFGHGLVKLNEAVLRLFEKFMKGEQIEVRAGAMKIPGNSASWRYFDVKIKGEEIGGWYKSRIKWPSKFRTDDPVLVQNELAKSKGDAENPPAQSLYTTMENLGVEDPEAEIDRIQQQLEDPRLHPGRMTAAIQAGQALTGNALPAPMAGLDPAIGAAQAAPAIPPAQVNANTSAAGLPAGDAMTNQGY
jgi:hypothetical protein